MFSSGAYQTACARSALEAVIERAEAESGYLTSAVYLLQGVEVAEGRPDRALALLDSVHAAGLRAAEVSYFIDALAGIDVGDRDDSADRRLREALGDEYEGLGLSRADLLGLLAIWNYYHGSETRALALRDRLEDAGADDPVAALLARAIDGHSSLAEGDTTAAVAAFESLVPPLDKRDLPYAYAAINPLARLKLAETYLAKGDANRAYEVATVFDHPEPIHFPPFVRPSLELRREAAARLGATDLTSRIDERLSSLGNP
jgi:hypothetical protein